MPEREAPRPADTFVSVVVIPDEGMLDVPERLIALCDAVSARHRDYEIVLVDNAMPSEVLVSVRDLLSRVACLRVLRLSRRSSIDAAVFAGLDVCIGDHVVVTALAYDSPRDVLDAAELVAAGHDVVQGEHTGPLGGGLAHRLARRVFYWYNRRFLDVDIPSRSTYLIGLSRRAVNAVAASGRTHRYLRHLVRFIGYRVHTHKYSLGNPGLRRSRSRPRWLDAVEMISSYSVHPLRFVSLLGLAAGVLSLLYGAYALLVSLTQSHIAPGWTTTSLVLSIMFFIVTLILAVQAEYVGRILAESRRESGYFLIEELESEMSIAETGRRNVTSA